MTHIHPRPGKLFVKLDDRPETTAGGLYLPEDARDEAQQGTVVACAGHWFAADGVSHPLNIAVGDRILLGKYSGVDVTVNHTKLVALSHTDVLAVLDPAGAEVSPCLP